MARCLRFELNWVFQGPNSPFLHAVDAGYFADAGIEVVFREGRSSSLVGDAIARGEADFGFGDIAAAMERSLSGSDNEVACLVPVFQRSPACLASLQSRGSVVALPQIQGCDLAGPPRDTAGRLLPRLLALNGLAGLTYSYRDVQPRERDAGLVEGTFRAVTGFDATIRFSMMAAGYPADDLSFLYFADCGLDIYAAAVLCSHAIAGDKGFSAVLRTIIERAWGDCRADPTRGVQAVIRRNPGADPDVVRQHLEWVLQHQVFPEGPAQFGALDLTKAERTLETARALNTGVKTDFDMNAFFLGDAGM